MRNLTRNPNTRELYEIARDFDYLREIAGNHGQRINGVQRWCGGSDGESWCLYFATFCLDIKYKGNAPIPRMGSCEELHRIAKRNDWLRDTPTPNDIALHVYIDTGIAHHATIVTPSGGIAGNTTTDGVGHDGEGVHETTNGIPCSGSSRLVYVHYPRE